MSHNKKCHLVKDREWGDCFCLHLWVANGRRKVDIPCPPCEGVKQSARYCSRCKRELMARRKAFNAEVRRIKLRRAPGLWVVVGVCDQTIAFSTESDGGGLTTAHKEAFLFKSEKEAQAATEFQEQKSKAHFIKMGFPPDIDERFWVEKIEDLTEFQSRKDTW